MAKWNVGSETGILRKAVVRANYDDLLVFGYACKIFRDDEKALHIDQGKHLIPWMGNNLLKIDRYDCRGALSELTPYEGTDHDSSRWLGLSEPERRIEMVCDEERYYALKYNEEELEMYQEEETKRHLKKGTEFQYNYDVPENPEKSEDVEDAEIQDEVFVPPLELNVPAGMEVPSTVKENSRIEKTASFVSNQGPQMEILIKTKQADNPQFNFMNKDHPLYKYYKYLLTAIKSGQYKVQPETSTTEKNTEEANEHEEPEGHYLHPSLVAAPAPSAQPLPPLPTVIYKPSADCAYSQLVSRIQGTQLESAMPPPLPDQDSSQNQMTYEQQQYYQQYYYATQYYEYYKQVAQQLTGQNLTPTVTNALQETGVTPEQIYALCQNQAEFQNILQSQAAYQQYAQQQSSNPYAQLVSNLSQSLGKDAFTAIPSSNDISKAPILYSKTETEPVATSLVTVAPAPPDIKESIPENLTKDEEKIKIPSIVQYGSDTDDDESGEESDVKLPPPDLQQIIDKMAVYVSKNGKDFESIVRAKGDIRFHFLNDSHEYNAYYRQKIGEHSNNDVQQNGVTEKPKDKKVIAPVCFSIKKPKEDLPKEIKSALPIEESDDELETNEETTPPVIPVPPPLPPPEVVQIQSTTPPLKEPIPASENGTISEIVNTTQEIAETPDVTEDVILEMIDISDDLEERRVFKRVENSKMDKITAALRERLALQLERKRKAAAFLKLKSNRTSNDTKLEGKSNTAKNSETVSSRLSNDTVSKSSKVQNKDVPIVLSKCVSNARLNKSAPKNESKPAPRILEGIINIEDSDLEEGEIKKRKKSSKKKKSHKRKHSKSRHESKSRRRHKERKKSKKRKKDQSCDSDASSST